MNPEAKVLAAILRELDRRKKAGEPLFWFKTHGAAMQQAGLPDLIVCYFGRFLAIEVKAPGKTATRLQTNTLTRIDAAGGFDLVADDLAAVRMLLDQVRSGVMATRLVS